MANTQNPTLVSRVLALRSSLPLSSLLRTLGIFLVCHELSVLSAIFPPGGSYPHLIWLTEGANLAALLLFGKEAWVGVLLAQWSVGAGLIGSLYSVAFCALRLALAQVLLERLHFNRRLERLRDFAVLILGGGVAAAIGTLAGAIVIWATGMIPRSQFRVEWRIGWIGDMAGILLLTPLILTWADAVQRRSLVHRWKEFGALFAGVLSVNFWLLSPSGDPDVARLPLSNPLNPLLIWVALRCGPIGVLTVGVALVAQTIWLTWAHWLASSRAQALAGFPLPLVHLRFTWLTVLVLAFAVQELYRARERVRVANRSLSALVETSPLAILALNASREVMHWNQAAADVFGWPAAERIGRPLALPQWDLLDDVLNEAFLGRTLSCLRSGCFRRDGEMLDVHIDAAPVRAKDGAITGIVAILADVTAQRRMEEELQQRHHLEALGRLAGGIAHDFNNILSVILGQAELLMMPPPPPALYRRLTLLRRAALHASSLTSRLLGFSRQRRIEPQWLDLNQVLQRMQSRVEERLDGEIELIFRPADSPCLVHADPVQCEQLLLNLCMCAAEGRGQVNRIELDIRTTTGAEDSALQTLVSVRYEARASAPESPGPHSGGTGIDAHASGLGLAIVADIVRETGAMMRISHDDGNSARLLIVFPAFVPHGEASTPGANRRDRIPALADRVH